MEIKGTLHAIMEVNVISDKFQKRDFVVKVVEDNPEYAQLLKCEMINDNCSELDGYKPGDQVEVQINLRGREWTDATGKVLYFNTLQAWRISRPAGSQQPAPGTHHVSSSGANQMQEPEWLQDQEPNETLPF